MPKKKTSIRPTQTQAKILRELDAYPDLTVTMYGNKVNWSGADRLSVEGHTTLRYSSVKVLLREGWIEKDETAYYTSKYYGAYGITDRGREAIEELPDDYFNATKNGLVTDDIITAIAKRHNPPEWAFIIEMRLGTGYRSRSRDNSGSVRQRVDAFAINCYPSKKLYRVAYEVKVSRGDFLNEVKHPEKREAAMRYSNLFYFAAPAGLIKTDELPDKCGLIEVYSDQSWEKTCDAFWRPSEPPDWTLVASIARSLMRV